MTYKELNSVIGTFKSEEFNNQKLSFPLAYKIGKFLKASEYELEFYQKNLNEIVKNYARKDDKGEVILEKDDRGNQKVYWEEGYEQEAIKEFEQLQNTTVELDVLSFAIEDFEGLDVTLSQGVGITSLIQE